MSWWNKYVGIPFTEKGRSDDSVDCWGLVRLVYKKELGIDLPSYSQDYLDTNDKLSCQQIVLDEKKNWIDVKIPQEFDVIILKIRGVPMHVGIVTKGGNMLHSSRGIGTVHEKFNSIRWKTNIIGFARHESSKDFRITPAV